MEWKIESGRVGPKSFLGRFIQTQGCWSEWVVGGGRNDRLVQGVGGDNYRFRNRTEVVLRTVQSNRS